MRLVVVTGIVSFLFLVGSDIVELSSAFSPFLSFTIPTITTALSAGVPSSSTPSASPSPLLSFNPTTNSVVEIASSSSDNDDDKEESNTPTKTTIMNIGNGYQSDYLPKVVDGEGGITFEDIAKYPGRAFLSRAGAPTKIEFGSSSENDNESTTSLIYLGSDGSSNTLTQKLWKRTIALNSDGNGDGDVITEVAKPPAGVGEEDTLSAEEKLRRERTRQLETGITNFEYSKGSSSKDDSSDCNNDKVLLCPIGNDLFIKREGEGDDDLIQIVDSSTLPGSVIDPHISDDGTFVVFVCDNELYMASTINVAKKGPLVQQITFDAHEDETGKQKEGIANGLSDFIAMEEMERNEGFWISPSSDLIAFEQSDESQIPQYKIMHSGAADPSRQEDHRYPFAGAVNPTAKVGIIDLQGPPDQVRWLDLESIFGEDMYLARVQWGSSTATTDDGGADSDDVVEQQLYVQVMNREQTELVLLKFDFSASSSSSSSKSDDKKTCDTLLKGEELLREKAPPRAWINLHENFIPLKKGGFIWGSERLGGFRHLYRYDKDLNCYPLTLSSDDTHNEWMVESCTSSMVDEEKNLIYFTGTKDSPKESHLYSTSLDDTMKVNPDEGRIIDRLTPSGGMHSVLAIDLKKQLFIDSWSSITQPHQVAVRSLSTDGTVVRTLHDGSSTCQHKLEELQLQPPEWFEVDSESTSTNDNKYSHLQQTMYGAIYKPDSAKYGDGPYPTIVSVYGGPHAQMVTDSFGMTADLRAQRLRSQGYAVIKLDNRGSSRRGLHFEIPIYHDMGNLEVTDQVTAIQYWIEKGIVDPDRVGMYGWSYGGYMSGMCLSKRPDIFKVAVAGAMVSSWDGYDTCYTERYMGTPGGNPDGYEKSDVMPYAKDINGSLLLVHGLIDENVHFRHTARFVNSLIKARKYYELLLFPNERHVPRGIDDKIFMEERISSFIERCL